MITYAGHCNMFCRYIAAVRGVRRLNWVKLRQNTCSCSSKVPSEPKWEEKKSFHKEVKLDDTLINHIERLALVNFSNEAAVQTLREAITFAEQLHEVCTDGVEPLDSVLENRALFLRDDKVTEGNCREDVLGNATIKEDDFYIAPPGNIPLSQTNRDRGSTDES